MPGLVDMASSLLIRGVEYAKLRGSSDLGSPTALLLLPVLYMAYRRFHCQGNSRLSSMAAGAGKQGNNWLSEKDDIDVDVGITWLRGRELKVLQAFGDTLLPGFEVGTKEASDAAVEQVGAVCGHPPSPFVPQSSRLLPRRCRCNLTKCREFPRIF